MKLLKILLLLCLSNLSFSQSKSIFKDESGNIKVFITKDYFQSLATETIQEIQNVLLSHGEFIHLATDKSNYYFLSDISQFSKVSKNKFYQEIYEAGFSFQIDHGLPDGYIWVITPKEKNSISNSMERIKNLLQQSTK